MSLNEMPRFMLNEVVLVHPLLPKKNENDKTYIWNPDKDAKMYNSVEMSSFAI